MDVNRFMVTKAGLDRELVDSEDSPKNSGDSPRSVMYNDAKIASTSTSRRSRRGSVLKRIVSVPIRDVVDGSKMKGDHMTAPSPSDSWAWRKYGQKPIKGSPYPRGYYRCSSSKGCPARKQVERSNMDPNMLVVTYSCEHNHPCPGLLSRHNKSSNSKDVTLITSEQEINHQSKEVLINIPADREDKLISSNVWEGPLIYGSEFAWFPVFDCTISNTATTTGCNIEVALTLQEEEEEESLFAGLGELPECSTVFRPSTAA